MNRPKKNTPVPERWIEQQSSHRLLERAYRLARIGTWEYDMETGDLYWSNVTKEVHGFDENYQPEVESTIELFREGRDREVFREVVRKAIEEYEPFDIELRIISGKGDERWIRATGEPEFENDTCVRFYGISQNVTDRRRAEEQLQLNEKRFKALVQDGSDLIAILDQSGNYIYVSPTSTTVLGISPEDFIGKNALDFIHTEDRDRVAATLTELPSRRRIEIDPFRFIDSNGEWRWIETTLTNLQADPAVGGFVANFRDVTEKIHHQERLIDSLSEKETLLAEIHHRVKNNLAVVSGFLQLQSAKEEHPEVLARLNDGIGRIQTMSTIHEQLYQSDSFSKLDFSDNIRLLVNNILHSYRNRTEVEVEFHDKPLHINIKQAIPCSLIVNEVVTNALKHAFSGREKGVIVIRLEETAEKEGILLEVADNGIGIPDTMDIGSADSLGMTLIRVLSLQLDAEYSYESTGKGTRFRIVIKKE